MLFQDGFVNYTGTRMLLLINDRDFGCDMVTHLDRILNMDQDLIHYSLVEYAKYLLISLFLIWLPI